MSILNSMGRTAQNAISREVGMVAVDAAPRLLSVGALLGMMPFASERPFYRGVLEPESYAGQFESVIRVSRHAGDYR